MATEKRRRTPDTRRLEKVAKNPGVYRRHAGGCISPKRCKCPYVVVWRDSEGKQRRQMFPTFELAREHKSKLNAGAAPRVPLSRDTVASYYERWLPAYRGRTSRGLDESTRREYRISFQHHILPLAIARIRMRDVSSANVRDWLRELEDRGASPGTIRRAKAALSVMLACAAEDSAIAANPAIGVRYVPSEAAKRRHAKRRPRALTVEDVGNILGAMDESWRAFFLLLTQTGLRVGEALGLTWRHVHLGDDPHLTVVEQVYRGQRKRLKTEASRGRVPLSPAMAQWLGDIRPHGVAPETAVFASKTGTPLSYANLYNRVLRPALVDAGIAVKIGETAKGKPIYDFHGVAFHAFRKACGSLLLHHGKTLKQVQGWLRHSQLTTTLNTYIDQVDDGLGGGEVWEQAMPGLESIRGRWHSQPADDAAHSAASEAAQ